MAESRTETLTNRPPGIVHPGSRVRLHLSLTLVDGPQVLSSFEEEPLELVLGDGGLDPGLETILLGRKLGEEDILLLNAGEVYGWPDPDKRHRLPLAAFPPEFGLSPGQVIQFELSGREFLAGTILEIADGQVQVDFNHPLAGRDLICHFQILAVDGEPIPDFHRQS